MSPINNLLQHNYKFLIKKLPNVEFNVLTVSAPTISLPVIRQPTNLNAITFHGDEIEFGDLSVTYFVDENLLNYEEIYNWIMSKSPIESLDKYDKNWYSDASLVLLSSNKKPIAEFQFINITPTSLSLNSDFNVQNSDVEGVTATATFMFDYFKFIRRT